MELSFDEKAKAMKHMKETFELAKKSYEIGNKFNSCILVDPVLDKVIAVGSDQTNNECNSIFHSVIMMFENFSESIFLIVSLIIL